MNGWARMYRVSPSGDVGGDAQVGEAWSARWMKPLDDGHFAVLTRYFYPAQLQGTGVYIECQTEFLVCTNPGDPGSSEVWADAAYTVVDGAPAPNASGYEYAAAAEAPSDEEWNTLVPDWAEVR